MRTSGNALPEPPSDRDEKWNAYLQARPEFRKWFMHRMEEESEELLALNSLSPAELLIRITSSNKVMQSVVEGSEELSNLYRRVIAGDEEVLQYDDGEALAAASLDVDYIKSVLEGLVKSERPYHLRFNATEADYAVNNCDHDNLNLVLRLLCAQVDGCDPGSKTAQRHAWAIQLIIRYNEHLLWDSVETLINTVCKYDNAHLLSILGNKDMVVDEDYLNNVLIPSCESSDVDENVWHDMAVRFVNLMNEEYQRIMDSNKPSVGSPNIRFYDLMMRVLPDYLTKNVDEVAFLNTVYDYVGEYSVGEAKYRPGFLKPELLDMLRTYGASFVEPLFMRMAEDMEGGPGF